MGTLIVHHRVRNYDTWRPVYDGHEPVRMTAGLTNGRVFRAADDPNDLVILLGATNRLKTQDFAGSDELKTAMLRAGVEGKPEIHYVEYWNDHHNVVGVP